MDFSCLPVGIALGSNLGDRAAEIEAGFAFLRTLAADGRVDRSTLFETAPVDCPPGSPAFLNAVAEIQVDPAELPPEELLQSPAGVRREEGARPQHVRNSARPLDLDILYYGDRIVRTPGLAIPHPRLTERRFVLEPLARLRPDLVLPGQGRSVREILAAGAGGKSRLDFGMDREHMLKIERLAYTFVGEGGPSARPRAGRLAQGGENAFGGRISRA